MLSWSTIEIVRYSYYVLSLVGVDIYIHKWLRYTLFIVLYPSGVFSEIATIFFAIPYISQNGLFGVQDFIVFAELSWITLFFYVTIFVYLPGISFLFLLYTGFKFHLHFFNQKVFLLCLATWFLKENECWDHRNQQQLKLITITKRNNKIFK